MKNQIVKSLFLAGLLSVCANASYDKTITNFKKSGGKETKELLSLIETDKYYKKGVDYLENPEFIETREVKFQDPEDKNKKVETIQQKLPNWPKALAEFSKSFDTYKNPISAYTSLHIIKTLYTKDQYLKEFSKFSKYLYENEKNICTAYIDYGEVLEKGYYQKIDLAAANKVYMEGFQKPECTGWYKNILGSKISYVSGQLKSGQLKK